MTRQAGLVLGGVVEIQPFGVFVELDDGRRALLEVVNFAGEGPHDLADYPSVGARLEAALVNVVNGQPRLSLRPADLERAKERNSSGGGDQGA